MQSAEECRKFAQQYLNQANMPGVSPRIAAVLRSMSRSFARLASQYQLLGVIAAEQRGQQLQ